ncbi:unnamed protein product [Cylicostephanus goldi]|uniref:MULE transposase domain-containing protein n=1 Tax=Cylicostephanus goldi TaxID=71465 RepID=A0A3P7Q678_CYLGO|nr:unnamed protein product [Cylicostephanus goldi]
MRPSEASYATTLSLNRFRRVLTALLRGHTFEHLRTNATYQVYRCTGCWLAVDCRNTMIAIIDGVPLYAITTKKDVRTYELIFAQLKKEMERAGPAGRLRIVPDNKRASSGAARKVPPTASVEGCAFHLAVAWNRKKDSLGLRKFFKGDEADNLVTLVEYRKRLYLLATTSL